MTTDASAGRAVERIVDGQAWVDFCDALKQAGSVVLAETAPNDPLSRAEGWRYLTRLLRGGLEAFVEASDPQAPEFRRPAHATIKMGMDNPDNIYGSAPIDGRFRYRVHGNRGSVYYLGFGSQKGSYGATGTLETTGYLDAADMRIDADGGFELIASAEPEAGNWLPLSVESSSIIVRQTRLDHAREVPASIRIERIDGPNQPRHLDPSRMDAALQGAVQFVRGCSGLFASWARDWEQHVNRLPRFDPERARIAGGDPNIAYFHSFFRLGPGEALVVEVTPPECDYWNFQLANYWLESLDYRYFPIHLNSRTARVRDDGSVRIVVAHEDPGVDNWLDTCGHPFGTMCWRWIRAKAHPEPRTRVVELADL